MVKELDMESSTNSDLSGVNIKLEPDEDHCDTDNLLIEYKCSEVVWIKKEKAENIEIKCDPEMDLKEEKILDDKKENLKDKVTRQTRQKTIDIESKTEPQKKVRIRKYYKRVTADCEDVYDSIDTIILTEEERQKEHENTLEFLTPLQFVCKDCAMGYNTEKSYEEHMKEHSVHLGSYLCELCNTHFKTSEVLEEHKQSHYIRYSCSLCHTQFKQKETAGCHIIQLHKSGALFCCSYCSKGFRRTSFLRMHEESCPKREKIVCDTCRKVFKNKVQLGIHKRIHKTEKKKKEPLDCRICNKSYMCRASLTRHMLSHDLNVTCESCNIVFPNRLILRHHNYETHNPKNAHKYGKQSCPHCPRVCVSRAMLKRHISRMHSDRNRKYVCDYCHRTYLTKSDVRSHISWSHMDSRREHVCDCGHAFRSPKLLKKHKDRQHANKKEYTCNFCGEVFPFKKLLKAHLKTHPEKKLACVKCNTKFKTRAELRAHKIEHENNMKEEEKEFNAMSTSAASEVEFETVEVSISPFTMLCSGKPLRGRPPLSRH